MQTEEIQTEEIETEAIVHDELNRYVMTCDGTETEAEAEYIKGFNRGLVLASESWRDDSSLEKWFPLTADRIKELERGSHWNTSEPPKGVPVVAIGRIIAMDEFSTWADPILSLVVWMVDDSGYEGWHYCRTGMTVARALDDEVKIDFWAPAPSGML